MRYIPARFGWAEKQFIYRLYGKIEKLEKEIKTMQIDKKYNEEYMAKFNRTSIDTMFALAIGSIFGLIIGFSGALWVYFLLSGQ